LASSRKQRVIGRTSTLTTSTKHKKGTKYQGELEGSIAEKKVALFICKKTPPNQQERAALRLNPKVVVTGYLYKVMETKFNKLKDKNNLSSNLVNLKVEGNNFLKSTNSKLTT
jgi:hypothetical protein